MCIIITKPAGYSYDYEELEKSLLESRKHNSHGGGFALKRAGTNQIILSKGFLYTEVLLQHIDAYDIAIEDELIIHLRFSTAGEINAENCHPFVVADNFDEITVTEAIVEKPVLAHNGTFINYTYKNSKHSDTVHFIEEFISKPNVLNSIYNIHAEDETFMDSAIGNNRLAVMFPDDRDMMLIGSWNVPENKRTHFFYSNYYYCNPYNGYTKPVIHTRTVPNTGIASRNRQIGFGVIDHDDDDAFHHRGWDVWD